MNLAAVDESYTSYASECVRNSGDVPGSRTDHDVIAVLAATSRELTMMESQTAK